MSLENLLDAMTIRIKDLKTESLIGIYDNERLKKQAIIIDLEIEIEKPKAHLTDNINSTVDYNTLQRNICSFVYNSNFYLVETLGYKLMEMILKEENIYKAYIEIHKPDALDNANISISYKGKKEKNNIIIY